MVLLAGQHNQHQPYVLDTFRWLSEEAPGSYGLLFIHDAEAQNDNAFVIWRLCRGELTEHTDPFLSPCIPTIEDPYQGE